MVVPNGYDYSCHALDAGVAGVLFRELAVPRIPLMWRTHVRGDGTIIQGGVSEQGALCRYRHQRTGGDSMGVPVRIVVHTGGGFRACRDYYGEYSEVSQMVVLAGDCGVRVRVCGDTY